MKVCLHLHQLRLKCSWITEKPNTTQKSCNRGAAGKTCRQLYGSETLVSGPWMLSLLPSSSACISLGRDLHGFCQFGFLRHLEDQLHLESPEPSPSFLREGSHRRIRILYTASCQDLRMLFIPATSVLCRDTYLLSHHFLRHFRLRCPGPHVGKYGACSEPQSQTPAQRAPGDLVFSYHFLLFSSQGHLPV